MSLSKSEFLYWQNGNHIVPTLSAWGSLNEETRGKRLALRVRLFSELTAAPVLVIITHLQGEKQVAFPLYLDHRSRTDALAESLQNQQKGSMSNFPKL